MTVPPPQDQPQQTWPQGAGGPAWGSGRQQRPPTQNQPQYHPQQQPRPEQLPPRARSPRNRNTLLGALVGVLVAALVVGGLMLANVVHWGSTSTAAADARPIELPETLSGLTDVAKAAAAKSPTRGAAMSTPYEHTYTRTVERYGVAFDGAGVGVRTYTNDDLEFFLTVIAVRADSPGLVNGPQADPADLKVVAQPNIFDLVVDGDVQCLQTVNQVVTEGKQVQDEDLITTVCRTTADGLTVYVFGGSGNQGSQGRQRMVDLAKSARSAITGS